MKYEPVIGIETHVQLKTKSKLFCGCNNDSRVALPNTNVCPVCLGLPGTLPVLNEQAVKLALKLAVAINGKVPHQTKFDRKNYFYPDLPKGYQITQFDQPIIGPGFIEFPLDGQTIKVGITRAHMEEDAGKLVHPPGADYSLVDLNRAGTPLVEIVSEPDIRSAAAAKAYAQELHNLVRYADVSEADLYFGNMRFDVNVSLRPTGATEFGTRSETKNLNSFRAVEKAVEYEIVRQAEVLDRGDQVVQETRGWDDAKQRTYSQRSKEEAHDYRYFPEPDLPPLVITPAMKTAAAATMPPLPNEIRENLINAGIPTGQTDSLVSSNDLTAVKLWMDVWRIGRNRGGARFAFNWLTGERVKLAEAKNQTLSESNISAEGLSAVAGLIEEGKLSSTSAKRVMEGLWEVPEDAERLAKNQGLIQVSDSGELEQWVDAVIAAHPEAVDDYRAGKQQALGALVGAVMQASRGQANPGLVNELLLKKLSE